MKNLVDTEIEFFLKLKIYKGIGDKKIADLLRVYSSAQEAYESLIPQKDIDFLYERECEWIQKYHVHVITCFDKRYPSALGVVHDYPILLYVFGQTNIFNDKHIAVVGSRYPLGHSLVKAHKLGQNFSRRGIGVVSGLAMGIDHAVHSGVLSVGGVTLAVLGSGIGYAMKMHSKKKTFFKIAEKGCVISEFRMNMAAFRGSFPKRNRLISGFALLGVVVVEGAKNSGSLITARCAQEQGREVYAMPGLADNPKTEGNHFLLRNGGRFLERVSDVLGIPNQVSEEEPLNCSQKKEKKISLQDCSDQEVLVLHGLSKQPIGLEELFVRVTQKNHLTFSELASIVTSLELKGLIKKISGQCFLKV